MLVMFVLNRPWNNFSPVNNLRRAAFFFKQHPPPQQGALLPAPQTLLSQNTSTQIPSASHSSCPTSGSLSAAPSSCAAVAAALISAWHSFAGTRAASLAVLSWPHTDPAVRGLTFSWSAGFVGVWSYVFGRENSSDLLLGQGPLLMAGEETALLSHEEV